MRNLLSCVTQEHDIRLVVLAGLVCLLACLTAFSLIARGQGAISARARWSWISGAAVVTGCGVWATHFVAMLAYRPGLPLGYDVGLTLLSVGMAIAIVWLGCAISLSGGSWAPLGGAVAGAGIGGMHYIGMAAMRVPAEVGYDTPTVLLSLGFGIVLGAWAFHLRERRRDLWGGAAAAAVFAAAIVTLHFTAMSAVYLKPNTALPIPDQVSSPEWLAVAVAAVSLMIIMLSLAGSVVDQHLAERGVREAERLRAHIAELEAVKRELEATGADLRIALDQAAASNLAKSQFLATMSHELRTPLNAVIGFAELLKLEIYGPLGDQRYCDYAQNIHQSGAHLLALINDILDFAKIDAGRLSLAENEVDLRELFAASLRIVEGAASDAQLVLRQDLPAGAELPVLRADLRRIKQVLLNLLSNAIKFTPGPGTVTLAARLVDGELLISVSDTGIGIAPADLPKAFEPFGQIDNRLARAYEGTGLGLPLCKQLMELHRGALTVESSPGAGTTVTLIFPAERVLQPSANEPLTAAAA